MESVIKLSEVKNSKFVVVESIEDLEFRLHKRLVDMGFVKGTKVDIIKNDKKRKLVLVGIRGFTISLDYFICSRIMVWGQR